MPANPAESSLTGAGFSWRSHFPPRLPWKQQQEVPGSCWASHFPSCVISPSMSWWNRLWKSQMREQKTSKSASGEYFHLCTCVFMQRQHACRFQRYTNTPLICIVIDPLTWRQQESRVSVPPAKVSRWSSQSSFKLTERGFIVAAAASSSGTDYCFRPAVRASSLLSFFSFYKKWQLTRSVSCKTSFTLLQQNPEG